MSDDQKFMGFSTETRTPSQIHCSSYAHNKMSEVIDCLLDKPMFQQYGVIRIEITPKYAKKSIPVSEKSSQRAEAGPQTEVDGSQEYANKIVTEQGITIHFKPKGLPAFSTGCL